MNVEDYGSREREKAIIEEEAKLEGSKTSMSIARATVGKQRQVEDGGATRVGGRSNHESHGESRESTEERTQEMRTERTEE